MQFIYNLINLSVHQEGIASTKVIMPNGNSITTRVDSGLYASVSTDGLGNGSLTNRTSGMNRVKSVADRLGRVTVPTFDAKENLIEIKAPDNSVTKFSYEPNFNLPTSVTDALGKTSTITYDAKGNPAEVKDPLGKISKLNYDSGQVTTYQYDANGRLISTTYNDGKVVSNTYDDEDRLVSLNDTASGAGQHNFTYDILDRLTQETNPRGTVSYAYDVLGRRTSLKINNQRNLNYSYDNNDRLTAITEGNETFGFSYDQLDRRAGMTLPNGISTAYSYDAAGRLTGMKYSKGSQVLRDLSYGYDEINRRTSYSGNTAPEPKDTATATATVNALNQYTTLNGKPVNHDENGNQTINSAVWDSRDRLVSLSGPNFTASFTYDAMGRRTSKTVNGQKKTYLYDGSDLISETGAEYTFGPGIDQPLERKSGQNEYYLSDALGSVIGLTDANGAIKTSYNYSPFGKKQTTGINSSNPFAFTGREDDDTGYYYYRARYYSPDQKRFISADPLDFKGGDTNLQAYVGNNPIDYSDPTGLLCLAGGFSASAKAGWGGVGTGGTLGYGQAACSGTAPNLADATKFSYTEVGGFAGPPGLQQSFPAETKANFAVGAAAGSGLSVAISNANDSKGFTSTPYTFSAEVDVPGLRLGSISVGYGGSNGVVTVTIGLPTPSPTLGGIVVSNMGTQTFVHQEEKFSDFGSSPSLNFTGNIGRTCSISNRR